VLGQGTLVGEDREGPELLGAQAERAELGLGEPAMSQVRPAQQGPEPFGNGRRELALRSLTFGRHLPGGWNRIQVEVDDLDELVENLRAAGASFRNDIVTGRGGKQILLDDPSGNPIELFEPN
jgi:catechol 2,3-dioxygenase-like lactoylglutathione lyase family enzyme